MATFYNRYATICGSSIYSVYMCSFYVATITNNTRQLGKLMFRAMFNGDAQPCNDCRQY